MIRTTPTLVGCRVIVIAKFEVMSANLWLE